MQLTHVPIIGGEILRTLLHYHWPGNVRELRNALERALILWDGEHFDLNLPIPQTDGREWSYTVSFPTDRGLRDVIDEVTQGLCVEALKRCQGNKKESACLLGIARDSLYRYLKQFNIESES
jgi:DNA-binding NtrC family response regulator